MAIVPTILYSGAITPSGANIVTPSITPSPNRLILAIDWSTIWGRGGRTAIISTLSGNSLNWVRMVDRGNTIGFTRHLAIFRAMGSSPTPGAVTISESGAAASFLGTAAVAILEFMGCEYLVARMAVALWVLPNDSVLAAYWN